MKLRTLYMVICLSVSVFMLNCNNNSKNYELQKNINEMVGAPTKTIYTNGDTIQITCNPLLKNISIFIDSIKVPIININNNIVYALSDLKATGEHNLIIKGRLNNKVNVIDTLGIEVWSDIKPEKIYFDIIKRYVHKTNHFTEGLEFNDDTLYEGTGINGESKLLKLNLNEGTIFNYTPLAKQYFGEGITIFNGYIYQLTWTSGICFRYSKDFKIDKIFTYPTQGWGMAHTNQNIIMSDGSNKIYFLTKDFRVLKTLLVYDNMGSVNKINELEYVNGYIFANIWETNKVVKIDTISGKVVGELNMEGILPSGIDTRFNVLNGIAFRPKENTFYFTGKNWPAITVVKLKEN